MKKTLSLDEVEKLAKLSGLELSDSEKQKIATQFGETISYVENLNDLDTSEVSALTNVSGNENLYFEDGEINKRLLTKDEAIGNSVQKKDSLFKVPKILSK